MSKKYESAFEAYQNARQAEKKAKQEAHEAGQALAQAESIVPVLYEELTNAMASYQAGTGETYRLKATHRPTGRTSFVTGQI